MWGGGEGGWRRVSGVRNPRVSSAIVVGCRRQLSSSSVSTYE
jgi:hypothetical protein